MFGNVDDAHECNMSLLAKLDQVSQYRADFHVVRHAGFAEDVTDGIDDDQLELRIGFQDFEQGG